MQTRGLLATLQPIDPVVFLPFAREDIPEFVHNFFERDLLKAEDDRLLVEVRCALQFDAGLLGKVDEHSREGLRASGVPPKSYFEVDVKEVSDTDPRRVRIKIGAPPPTTAAAAGTTTATATTTAHSAATVER